MSDPNLIAGEPLKVLLEAAGEGDSLPIGATMQLTLKVTKRDPKTGRYDPSDPTGLTLFLSPPNSPNTSVAYPGTVVRNLKGSFHFDLLLDQSGSWSYRWQASYADGSKGQTADRSFEVAPSRFIPG